MQQAQSTHPGDRVSSKPAYRFAVLAVGLVALLIIAANSIASSSVAAQVMARKTSLGTIVVDGKGRTLYLFMKDRAVKSACYGACAVNWPPFLTVGKPRAAAGIKASLLGTSKRKDGKVQVTYNHHPLYRFSFDSGPGSTTGEGSTAFGATWWAVSPKGVKVPKP